MTAAHAFTDAELTLIGKLIEDRCPPGEIAKTVGCQPWTIRDRFPASRMTHPERVDHAITAVATEDGYTKWHILADLGDVLTLNVGWSCGNPFYYGYGFTIGVSNTIDGTVVAEQKVIDQ